MERGCVLYIDDDDDDDGDVDGDDGCVGCYSDGAGLSCILCGLMMAVEALEEEDRVSPFLLTRLIQAARPQAFKTAVSVCSFVLAVGVAVLCVFFV